MSKNYVVYSKRKEILHVRNGRYGTVNAKIATKKFRNYFYAFPLLKMSFRMTKCEAPYGGLEAGSAKSF